MPQERKAEKIDTKRLTIICCALGLLLLAVPVSAVDVDGTWTGKFDASNGPVSVWFTLTEDSAIVTGTTNSPDVSEISTSDGKIDGAQRTFSVRLDFRGTSVVFDYKGVGSGDEIKPTTDFIGIPFACSVKRKM